MTEGHTHDERKDCNTQQGAPHAATINNMESNKLLPWLILLAIMSTVGVVSSIFCFWQLSKTETEHRLVDNDWQQMNAFLAREGVVKDANGFYVLGKKEK